MEKLWKLLVVLTWPSLLQSFTKFNVFPKTRSSQYFVLRTKCDKQTFSFLIHFLDCATGESCKWTPHRIGAPANRGLSAFSFSRLHLRSLIITSSCYISLRSILEESSIIISAVLWRGLVRCERWTEVDELESCQSSTVLSFRPIPSNLCGHLRYS